MLTSPISSSETSSSTVTSTTTRTPARPPTGISSFDLSAAVSEADRLRKSHLSTGTGRTPRAGRLEPLPRTAPPADRSVIDRTTRPDQTRPDHSGRPTAALPQTSSSRKSKNVRRTATRPQGDLRNLGGITRDANNSPWTPRSRRPATTSHTQSSS